MASCWGGIVALPGGCDLQRERLAGSGGDAGCDCVPPQTAMHLVEMTAHVGFGGKGFEAHWAGFSGWCAESSWPTSSNNNNGYYFVFPSQNLNRLLWQTKHNTFLFFNKRSTNRNEHLYNTCLIQNLTKIFFPLRWNTEQLHIRALLPSFALY